MQHKKLPDFHFKYIDSDFLLFPESEAAKRWVEEHICLNVWTSSTGIAVEPSYVYDLLRAIADQGMEVEQL
jgi:hypothetical protein